MSLHVFQDFVRLPLQNQSSQAAQSTTGSSITASGTGLSSQFGLSSGFTSGPGIGIEGMSRGLDETAEPTPGPQLR